jgi:hypothetical protein
MTAPRARLDQTLAINTFPAAAGAHTELGGPHVDGMPWPTAPRPVRAAPRERHLQGTLHKSSVLRLQRLKPETERRDKTTQCAVLAASIRL